MPDRTRFGARSLQAGRAAQMFGRTVRPDVWPDFRAVAQSIMRPGPTLGQLLQLVVWAAAPGQGDKKDRMGQKGRAWAWTLCQSRHRAQAAGHMVPGTVESGEQDRQSEEADQDRRPGQMAGNGRSKPMVRGVRKEVCLTVLSTSGPRLFAGALVSFRLQGSLSVLVACLSEEPVCRLPRFLRFLSALYRFFRQFFSFPGP